MEKAQEIISLALDNGEFLRAVFSNPFEVNDFQKIEVRPLTIKGKLHYQVTRTRQTQALHENYSLSQFKLLIFDQFLPQFRQAYISLKTSDYHVLNNNKKLTFLRKNPQMANVSLSHNRKKQYLLEEGVPIPFLIELGIMTKEGKIIAKKSDKYRQLNRFLEMVDDVLPFLKNKTLHIVDFGCGKAYLTFALYHYLHLKGYELKIVGLDLKKEVVIFCQNLAKKLEFHDLQFLVGDIAHHNLEKIDLMISLHACDTATDAALAKAINAEVPVILSVPCCQHELFSQIENTPLNPLLKHGILKERFSSLVTDAARAQILEIAGYRTQLLEFIDLEHTPKNLLIRAVKLEKPSNKEKLLEAYQQFKKELNIIPSLEQMIKL